ncbi:hypothetical protein [Leptolyngbya sp. FACHB-261]|uniref:hypothetical protein n=1 Tax=Leptolyngbya sp. FACHB-261 TaxID=2692806 RepID=UPI001683FD99|nr:hypothetical protein [Leptolyngbya sp. FACHB-261]MBD2105063.1 hypothetical protein [Leptolyngbya sp. FACHB-261]
MSRQRVQHIVDSYELSGKEPLEFQRQLETLLQTWDIARVELALCEVLVQSWLRVPLPRGTAFLQLTAALLQAWETGLAEPSLTPIQFQRITGLESSFKATESALEAEQELPAMVRERPSKPLPS